ncbi:LysR family transcriptional regulator [Thalassotalea sp. LPB0316]|uniref:LysR family transcriptional regulator n=1 Tax=Thalassotalea sp. LPB0316 TaxID=2769490 RepID=UPI001867D6AC|nr:LysR family transcriptional regulator [Thalassotalea sp. LPB0316]QOL25306.1 LysR family transcriptional regulator [Thalassotalea sp. LPB0316]
MNWEDIKIFLEVARTEKLAQAAKRLGKDASTVSRRIHKLEEQLSTKLFERSIDGHELTSDGAELLERARRMEQQALSAFNQIALENTDQTGLVRLGLTEAFASYFLTPNLPLFYQQHPNIELDLLHFTRDVKISRNEADIAISLEKPKNTSMIVTKLCDYQLKLYVNKHSAVGQRAIQQVSSINQLPWVSYVDSMLYTEQLAYFNELTDNIVPVFRSNSVISQYQAIKNGIGVGVLPCFLAEQDEALTPIFNDQIKIARTFYLVTHPECKRLARVAHVWEFLKQLCIDKQAFLMPEH